jgi:hypothetical protein
MIVRQEDDRLVLVRQADHAYLSGRLAAAWGRPPWEPVEPFPAVATGARQHDDAWVAYDEAPEVRDGRPLSFFEVDRMQTSVMYAAGARAVAELDPYAGLLVSLHYSGFFASHWGWEPFSTPDRFPEPQASALRLFVRDERNHQQELMDRLRLGPDDEVALAANYKWLQLWDRISLDICRQSPVEPWAVEYPAVPLGYTGDATAALKFAMVAPGRYTLNPYPLLPPRFSASVPVTRVGAGQPDAESFLKEWRAAPEEHLRLAIEAA